MEEKEGTSIKIKVEPTGDYDNFFDGEGMVSHDVYKIIDITGGELPPLEYEHAPLPFSVPRPDMGGLTWKTIHKPGNCINDTEIAALESQGVQVEFINRC